MRLGQLFLSSAFLLVMNASIAQDADPDNKYVGLQNHALTHFEPKSMVYTAGSDVNLREKASVQGKVVTKLPIATAVKIEKEMPDSFQLNGWQAPWYQVSVGAGATLKKGFIWGGFLTGCVFKSVRDKNILFIGSVAGYNYDSMNLTIQLRAIKANVEISKLDFKTVGESSYYIGGKSHGDVGLAGLQEVLGIKLTYPACDYGQGEYLILWDGKKLSYGAAAVSGSSAGVFYSETHFFFPKDKEGKKDAIVLRTRSAQFDEVKNDYKKPTVEKKVFAWKNGKLF